jgi:hypothetical protein
MRRLLLCASLALLTSCSVLDHAVSVVDPETGETVETTVGDLAADAIDSTSSGLSSTAGQTVGALTGNPVMGAGAGAVLATLLGAASARMRRKKAAPQTAPTEPPSAPEQ